MKKFSIYKLRNRQEPVPFTQIRYRIIYEIKCTLNDRCYIGSSVDGTNRWNQHISGCLSPIYKHLTNVLLAHDVKEFGIESFTFRIMKRCFAMTDEERISIELDLIKSRQPFYNIAGK